MSLTKGGYLYVAPLESIVIRLKSTGVIDNVGGLGIREKSIDGTPRGPNEVRVLGTLKAVHVFWRHPTDSYPCSWRTCKMCEQGKPRRLKIATDVVHETDHGPEPRIMFLPPELHKRLSAVADRIEAAHVDPQSIRIRVERTKPRGPAYEVEALDPIGPDLLKRPDLPVGESRRSGKPFPEPNGMMPASSGKPAKVREPLKVPWNPRDWDMPIRARITSVEKAPPPRVDPQDIEVEDTKDTDDLLRATPPPAYTPLVVPPELEGYRGTETAIESLRDLHVQPIMPAGSSPEVPRDIIERREKLGGGATSGHPVAVARCRHCGSEGVPDNRLVLVPGADFTFEHEKPFCPGQGPPVRSDVLHSDSGGTLIRRL